MYADDEGVVDDLDETPLPPPPPPAPSSSMTQLKFTSNITSNRPAQPEEAEPNEYDEEQDIYQNYANEDNVDEDTTKLDGSQLFGGTMPSNSPDIKPPLVDSNNRKNFDLTSTSRIPFIPSNLWRELFSRPGILVGRFYLFSLL